MTTTSCRSAPLLIPPPRRRSRQQDHQRRALLPGQRVHRAPGTGTTPRQDSRQAVTTALHPTTQQACRVVWGGVCVWSLSPGTSWRARHGRRLRREVQVKSTGRIARGLDTLMRPALDQHPRSPLHHQRPGTRLAGRACCGRTIGTTTLAADAHHRAAPRSPGGGTPLWAVSGVRVSYTDAAITPGSIVDVWSLFLYNTC